MIQAQKGRDQVLLTPQLVTDAATATANMDCRDGDYATIRINFAAEQAATSGDPTISLLESDDTVVTNFTTVTANITKNLETTGMVRYEVDLRGRRRYLRLAITAATPDADITCGAIGTLSRLDEAPANTTDMQSTTYDTVVIL